MRPDVRAGPIPRKVRPSNVSADMTSDFEGAVDAGCRSGPAATHGAASRSVTTSASSGFLIVVLPVTAQRAP
jgi:hypothetical protein